MVGADDCAVGKCLHVSSCTGVAQAATPLDEAALGAGHAKSLSAWVRLDDDDSGTALHVVSLGHLGDATPCAGAFALVVDGGVPVGMLGNGCGDAARDITGGWALSTRAWHHLALVHDGATTTLFVDGRVAGTASGALATRAESAARSVVTLGGGTGASCSFGVDEARVFAFALSGSEVAQLYAAAATCPRLSAPVFGTVDCSGSGVRVGDVCSFTCGMDGGRSADVSTRRCQADGTWSGARVACLEHPPAEANDTGLRPVHAWDFDVASSMSSSAAGLSQPGDLIAFADATGSHAWLVASSPTTGFSSVPHVASRPSLGSYLDISQQACTDGAYLRVLDGISPALLGTGPVSLSLWVKATSLDGDGSGTLPLVSLGGSRSGADAACTSDAASNCNGGRLALSHAGGAGGAVSASVDSSSAQASSVATPTGDWVHVAAVYDDGALSVFVDGAVDSTTVTGVDRGSMVDEVLRVGRDTLFSTDATVSCGIAIDDLRVYARALTASDIAAVVRRGVSSSDAFASNVPKSGDAMVNNATGCATHDGSAHVADDSSVVMVASGRAACALEVTQTRVVDVSAAAADDTSLALDVTFSANDAFRCGFSADGSDCPRVTLALDGDTVAEVVLDGAMAAASGATTGMATVRCSFTGLGSSSSLSAATARVSIAWDVPGTAGGTLHGGHVTVHNVALVSQPAGSRGGSHWPTSLAAHALADGTPQCRYVAPVASANPVAPSCLAVQLGALAAGSDFVDVPSFRDTQFLTDPAASPDRQVATSFTRAATGAVAGDGATVFVRAVDVAAVSEGTIGPAGMDTTQRIHVGGIQCISGDATVPSAGTHAAVASVHVPASDGACSTVPLSFAARASGGSSLSWSVTASSCASAPLAQCPSGDVVASGVLYDGKVSATGASPAACSDPTSTCFFESSIPTSRQSQDLTLWLAADATAVLPSGASASAFTVTATAISVASCGDGATKVLDVAAGGEGWFSAGGCHFASTVGGAFVRFMAHIDAGDASFEAKLVNTAVAGLDSTTCACVLVPWCECVCAAPCCLTLFCHAASLPCRCARPQRW